MRAEGEAPDLVGVAEGQVAGTIDDAHAAAANLVEQLVARRPGGGDTGRRAWLGSGSRVGRQILGQAASIDHGIAGKRVRHSVP
jgi:hypothetical protein